VRLPQSEVWYTRCLNDCQTSPVLAKVAYITLVSRRVKSRIELYVQIISSSSTSLRIDRSQVTVGSPSRALLIADHLDKNPVPFKLTSERGFTTITGRYEGVPISIVSTGMGFPNTDFFVREVRESLSGDMLVVRWVILSVSTSSASHTFKPSLGSCGALVDIPPGSLVVPKACVGINRNWDYDFVNGDPTQQPYSITKPVRTRYQRRDT